MPPNSKPFEPATPSVLKTGSHAAVRVDADEIDVAGCANVGGVNAPIAGSYVAVVSARQDDLIAWIDAVCFREGGFQSTSLRSLFTPTLWPKPALTP